MIPGMKVAIVGNAPVRIDGGDQLAQLLGDQDLECERAAIDIHKVAAEHLVGGLGDMPVVGAIQHSFGGGNYNGHLSRPYFCGARCHPGRVQAADYDGCLVVHPLECGLLGIYLTGHISTAPYAKLILRNNNMTATQKNAIDKKTQFMFDVT